MKIKNYNEHSNDMYLIGNVNYLWVKKLIKLLYRIEPKNTSRLEILINRKTDLCLDEYQNLYDYWNFCDINTGKFDVANNDVGNYKNIIVDWVWYLTICQLFPDEMKKSIGNGRNLYDDRYEQILNLPKLTGDLENDKIIFYNVIRNEFFESKSPVRNGLMLYDIYFSKNYIF